MRFFGSGEIEFLPTLDKEELWKRIVSKNLAGDCLNVPDVFKKNFGISVYPDGNGYSLEIEGLSGIPGDPRIPLLMGCFAGMANGSLTLQSEGDEFRIKIDPTQPDGYIEEEGEITYPSDKPKFAVWEESGKYSRIAKCVATREEAKAAEFALMMQYLAEIGCDKAMIEQAGKLTAGILLGESGSGAAIAVTLDGDNLGVQFGLEVTARWTIYEMPED